jgi:Fungal specific transcription factor domain
LTGKRRKIKCIYQSEVPSICAGCLDKGTTCLSQEYLDVQSIHDDTGNEALAQRLRRVEVLLQKLIENSSQRTEETHATIATVDIITPSSTSATTYASQSPFVSLFGHTVGQQAEANTSMAPPQADLVSASSPPASTSQVFQMGRIEKLQQELAALLPCQEDVDYLSDTSGWWFIRRHIMPHLLGVSEHAEHDLQNPFDVSTVSASHPMIIARLLLCLALSIQQLPPNIIDSQRFHTKVPLREMMEKIITFVTATVTYDDELTGSIEGIECLVLQTVYQINAGNLRRAWLTFRRAINVAQLMGLDRVSLKSSQDMADSKETRRYNLWYQIMRGV